MVFLPGEPDNRRELTAPQIADLFPDAIGPWQTVREGLTSEVEGIYVNVNQVETDEWVRNRVALIGDAAHAMSPTLGQGAGVGIEDAALLADLLTMPHLPVPLAFSSYERARQPVAREAQANARTDGAGPDLRRPGNPPYQPARLGRVS
ncbi:FAD-dependent oxidoreductase [Fodinicola feengrottensis]|uniref:FAD-dependent oxidoreductase n=1 Tax=Fodinicola feengrottensis TaxID=435914 RepID=UPI0013D11A77|nr:FAD-dependent monooxygenase [Fodinicola feengrottensis]